MVRKNVILRYVLTFSLLLSFCVVGFGGSAKAAAAQCTTQIRYIRDSINGNTIDKTNQWAEIEAYSGNVNVARNKKVTASSGTAENLAWVNDGDWGNWPEATCDHYTTLGAGQQWVQIDLGQRYKVDYIRVWHYYEDSRKYHNNVTQVSADGVTWVTLFDSAVSGELEEYAIGHTLQVADPYAQASNSKGIPVRYIRDSVTGSTANAKDCWMEIAAFAPSGTDVALNKPVTSDFSPALGGFYSMDQGLDAVTDGDYTTGGDTVALSGTHYVQVDLGSTYNIDRIQVWHCYDDRFYDYRKYNFVMQVSTDGVHWLPVYDSSISGTYGERSSVNIINLDISVSHPSSVHFEINPNNSAPFVDGEIPLKNNSDMPVKVYLQSLSEASGGNLKLNNVLPSAYSDWSKLTKSQTKTDAAFGVRVKEKAPSSGAWQSINQTGIVYTANMGKTLMGTLNAKGTGTLVLDGICGLSWDRQYTIAKNISFIFSSY